jgi:hypothetical protein
MHNLRSRKIISQVPEAPRNDVCMADLNAPVHNDINVIDSDNENDIEIIVPAAHLGDNVLRLRLRVIVKTEPKDEVARDKINIIESMASVSVHAENDIDAAVNDIEIIEPNISIHDVSCDNVLVLRSRIVVKPETIIKSRKKQEITSSAKLTNSPKTVKKIKCVPLFTLGTIVYAKVKGFAPWPARVVECRQKSTCKVLFFVTLDTRVVCQKKLTLFSKSAMKKFSGLRTRNYQEFVIANAEAKAHFDKTNKK